MKLTKNFQDTEFKVSRDYPELADAIEINDEDRVKMFLLCAIFLQPVRDLFGTVTILSGKRTPALNHAVGGAPNSDHLYTAGTSKCAVDFTTRNAPLRDIYEHIRDTRYGSYGQLLYYTNSNFIHLSLPTDAHINDAKEWAK